MPLCFRHPERQRGYPQQLQPLPHQDHQLGRDHYGRAPEQICLCLQLQGAGARVQSLPRVMPGINCLRAFYIYSQHAVFGGFRIQKLEPRLEGQKENFGCVVTLARLFN